MSESKRAAGVVLSDALQPFEWLSRYLGHHPQALLQSSDPKRVPVVDGMVTPLRDRWVYAVIDRLDPRVSFVGIEIYVDADGTCFFENIHTDASPVSPIGERTPPLHAAGNSGPTIALPMTDSGGNAVEVRLLLSRFRLPSAVTKKIGSSRRLQKSIRNRIAPLWEWAKGENELSTLISSDGYSLVETPLYYSPTADPDEDDAAPRDESMQVWVGTDPFTVVMNRSDLYVDAREDYLREFEPTSESGRKVVARTALAQAISDAVMKPDEMRARYGGCVRGTAINEELNKVDRRRRRRVKKYEARAAALCKVLDDPLFQLLVTGSLHPELIEGEDRSEPVCEAVEALGVAARRLEESRFGRALYMEWVSEAEKDRDHLLNACVLPTGNVHVSAFKAFRWGSKALASIVKTTLEHRAALRKVSTRLEVAELLEPAVRLSLPNHASQHVVDLAFVQDMLDEIEVVLQRTKLSAKVKVRVPRPGIDVHRMMYEWTQADELTKTKGAKRFLGIRTYGAMVLDGVNVIIAMSKIGEAEGSDARSKAIWSTGAAGIGAARNLVEQVLNWEWAKAEFGITEARALGTRRVLAGIGGVVATYYVVMNAKGAASAFRRGDNDRGYALSVATAAELAGLVTELYWIFNPVSLAAPWIVVGAAAVAAAAYIVAEATKDDPLEDFLTRCDWGVDRYSEPETRFSWDDGTVGAWKEDLPHQSVLLLRLLVRMRAWWDLESWPSVTVNVAWNIQDPTAELEVEWAHSYKNGKVGTPLRAKLSGDELNWQAPYHLRVTPERRYTSMSGIDEVVLTLKYRPSEGAPASVLRCVLMEDGVGKVSGSVGHV
ncbi:MAG: hypothetical protein ACE37F_37050 [Nannocystaceae bacterium]|nr:hypothetical protein [bacterium]